MFQALPDGTVGVYNYDFKTNAKNNIRIVKSVDLGLGDRFDTNDGWRIPNFLVRAYASDQFRDAFGANADAFWKLFMRGDGSVFYMSSMSGPMVYNNREYDSNVYRFSASYAIFTGKSNPAVQVSITFYVSQLSPK